MKKQIKAQQEKLRQISGLLAKFWMSGPPKHGGVLANWLGHPVGCVSLIYGIFYINEIQMTSTEHIKEHALIIYGFFNNPFNRPSGWSVKNVLDWMKKEANLNYYCGICLDGLGNITKDGQSPERTQNLRLPKHDAVVLHTQPWWFVTCSNNNLKHMNKWYLRTADTLAAIM